MSSRQHLLLLLGGIRGCSSLLPQLHLLLRLQQLALLPLCPLLLLLLCPMCLGLHLYLHLHLRLLLLCAGLPTLLLLLY
jgi:hypothetical protein